MGKEDEAEEAGCARVGACVRVQDVACGVARGPHLQAGEAVNQVQKQRLASVPRPSQDRQTQPSDLDRAAGPPELEQHQRLGQHMLDDLGIVMRRQHRLLAHAPDTRVAEAVMLRRKCATRRMNQRC